MNTHEGEAIDHTSYLEVWVCIYQLQLGDNKLNGGLEVLIGCPKLSELGLAGNRIGELEDLKPLVW